MENSTKTRILEEALVCFAENGYKGTNLRDLADKLNLSKSALYRHFASKEDMWNAVIEMMIDYYEESMNSAKNGGAIPKNCDELSAMTMNMLDFTMHDRKVILTRRLLLTEQFRDKRACELATMYFFTRTKDTYSKIFEQMMKDGILTKDDPEILAIEYTTPITTMLHVRDREPEKEPEIIQQIEAYVKHFISVYKA